MNRSFNTPEQQAKLDAINNKLTETMIAALKAAHNAVTADPSDLDSLARQRKGEEILGKLVTPPIGFQWDTWTLGDMPMAWVRPERSHDTSRMILYCHGGGYVSGNLGYARVLASKLSSATGLEVLAFEYRLAPEHPHPAALEDALAVWDHLMHQGWGARQIILAGDSAGGNLALTLALALRDSGRFLPGSMMLLSPWTDLTLSGDSYESCREADPILTRDYLQSARDAYAPEADWSEPQFSPLFADLHGLPPTLIQVGEREILRDDAQRLRDAMMAADVPCVYQCWPGMWHVFQVFPGKSSGEAIHSAAEFVRRIG